MKTWHPKKKKTSAKTSALWFGVPFLKSQNTYSDFVKVFTHFAQISIDFARILSDFARIFTKSKVLGVRFHPRLLHQWTRLSLNRKTLLKTHVEKFPGNKEPREIYLFASVFAKFLPVTNCLRQSLVAKFKPMTSKEKSAYVNTIKLLSAIYCPLKHFSCYFETSLLLSVGRRHRWWKAFFYLRKQKNRHAWWDVNIFPLFSLVLVRLPAQKTTWKP